MLKAVKSLLGLDSESVKLANGDKIAVRPLTLRQSILIQQFFQPVAEFLAEHGGASDVFTIYTERGEHLINTVAVAIGKTPDYVEQMDRADFERIFAIFSRVERNFLSALVVAAHQKIKDAARAKPTGQPSSRA